MRGLMPRGMLGRRALLASGVMLADMTLAAARVGAQTTELRLGVLQFGTVQWVADVIRRHALDRRHGFTLTGRTLANTDAGRISLMAGANDVVLLDWPFVVAQRQAGNRLCFAPFSSATGGIMTPADSIIRGLGDLRGRRLGVAGGPADKSWLVVRAAAHAQPRIDLASEATCVYGAPPLLSAKLQQGELDAVLTYWNFAAKLEAAGFREVISVSDCLKALDIPPDLGMVGWVFAEDYKPINDFLAAVSEAEQMLADSPAEWDAVRPLMNADNDGVFRRLRDRFLHGRQIAEPDAQVRGAQRLLSVLHQAGAEANETLPPGVFWPVRHGSG